MNLKDGKRMYRRWEEKHYKQQIVRNIYFNLESYESRKVIF